jgi:hypothetical protein
MTLLAQQGMPAVWRRSIAEALDVIELLDARITPIDHELRPLARTDARFSSPRKLIGYAAWPRRSRSPATARAPARSPSPARGPCAGPPSKPPNTPGDRPTPGTRSTPTSPSAPARTRPRPPSRARS